MTPAMVLARSEADAFDRGLFEPRAITTIRYADAAAWVMATAVARALRVAQEAATAASDRIGAVVTTPRGPVDTMVWVAQAAREGYSSPLRYPASNPGSLAGVACIALALRGPTLTLTMEPGDGAPTAVLLGRRFLERGDVALMVIGACWERASNPDKDPPAETRAYAARCLLLGQTPGGPPIRLDQDCRWLAGGQATEID